MPSPYTSARSGNWDASDVDTWGQGMGVYPQLAGDVFTIVAGHTIIYNVNSAVQLGQGTINANGVLTFKKNANTRLAFGHVNFVINGTLKVGEPGLPIQNGFQAIIEFNTTVDNAKGFNIAATAIINMVGDVAYFGDLLVSYLAANWVAGQTFTVLGNVIGKWQINQQLILNRNLANYSAQATDSAIVTIANLAPNGPNTDITIAEAFPGVQFNIGGIVLHLSRNVIIRKVGVVLTTNQQNTFRPYFSQPAGATGLPSYYEAAEAQGFYQAFTSFCGSTLLKCVCRNGRCGPENSRSAFRTSCIFASLAQGFGNEQACDYDSCYFIQCNYGMRYLSQNRLTGCKVLGCAYGVSTAAKSRFISCDIGLNDGNLFAASDVILDDCYIFGCANGGIYAEGRAYIAGEMNGGALGYDRAGNLKKNPAAGTADLRCEDGQYFSWVLRNVKCQPGGPGFWQIPGVWNRMHKHFFQDYMQTPGDHRQVFQYGNCVRNIVTVRPGGASSSIEMQPGQTWFYASSSISSAREFTSLTALEWEERALSAGMQSRQIYAEGTGWGAMPTAQELWLEVEYIPNGSAVPSKIYSAEVLPANSQWTAFSVSFNPAVGSSARYRFRLIKYTAGAKIFVDTMLIRVSHADGNLYAYWADGQTHLQTGPGNLPSEHDVENGIAYGNGFTGVCVIPSQNNVRNAIGYGAHGTEFLGNIILPAIGDVRDGIFFGALGVEFEGNLELPDEDDVRDGIGYGALGAEFAGTIVLPAEIAVQVGVKYGWHHHLPALTYEHTGSLIWIIEELEAAEDEDDDMSGDLDDADDMTGEVLE